MKTTKLIILGMATSYPIVMVIEIIFISLNSIPNYQAFKFVRENFLAPAIVGWIFGDLFSERLLE
jgi:hypothetical protein